MSTYAFSVVQNTAFPKNLLVTDLSTDIAVSIVSRRVSFRKYDGTYLKNGTSNTWAWPLADEFIEPAIMDKDYALYILVEWLDISGDAVDQEDTYKSCDLNVREALYDVLRRPLTNPLCMQDVNYLQGVMNTFTQIYAAKNAVEIGGDLAYAQLALDTAKLYLDNLNIYF